MRMLPNSVIGLLEELEVDYPPKCKSPDETLEAHAQYAGKVELVSILRGRYDAELKKNVKKLPQILQG